MKGDIWTKTNGFTHPIDCQKFMNMYSATMNIIHLRVERTVHMVSDIILAVGIIGVVI